MQTSGPGRPSGDEVRAAARFTALIVVVAVAVMVLAAVWASTCNSTAIETAACATPYRVVLSSIAPLILLYGGARAFVRTYQSWRGDGIWWGWHGAGWFLLAMMMVVLVISGPPIIGPVTGD